MQEGAVHLIMRNVLIVSAYSIGYLTRMPMRNPAAHRTVLLAACLSLMAACSQLTMPRFTDPEPAQPVIPASVRIDFDETVRTAILEHAVCGDTIWRGQLGDALIRAFERTGQSRFAQVTVGEPDQTPRPVSSPSTTAIHAAVKLTHRSFTRGTRTGDEDNFIAQLEIRMSAIFQDAKGREFPEAPLAYSEHVSLWTPQYGGNNQCATGGLDAAMERAAEYLANQFAGYVAELMVKTQEQTVAGRQIPGSPLPSGAASALTLRATLLDENNNLILEGGEKVGIRIDATNTSATPTSPSTVSLSGTPVLLDAFSTALSSQAELAGLQPGETTSTILWGTLPSTIESTRGELTVTVAASGGTGGAATQTLVASLAAGKSSATRVMPPPSTQPALGTTGQGHNQDRYAVIVGLSLYRSPWPGWKEGLSFQSKETAAMFARTLGVPEGNILLLQDELAGQTDIEEALSSWLSKRVSKDSIVFFYFAGQTVADPKNGEVYLIPYDSTPASTTFRLISLRYLQSRLQKLGAKVAIAILDSPVTVGPAVKDGKITKPMAPNWIADLDGTGKQTDSPLVQVSRLTGSALLSNKQTNHLLAGLAGAADLDHDGIVTLGEWLRSLRGTAVTAPALPPTLAVQSIPLARVNSR